MSDLISALNTLFTFLFTQLGNFANFFTTNVIGQIIVGIVLFSIITSLLTYILNRMK